MKRTPSHRLSVRRSNERGLSDHGWLRSRHTFSFAGYHDPAHMGFRSLRVINDDMVAAGRGFPEHPHRDMEIFSYVLEGSLSHRDSLGNGRVLSPGQVQLMSAGTGVRHSEFNASESEGVHFLQIWIHPRQTGLPPNYTEWHLKPESAGEKMVLLISPDGRGGSAVIQQDAFVYRLRLQPGDSVEHELVESRGAWLQVASGQLDFQGVGLATGDGASVEEAGVLNFKAMEPTEALLFDLA